MLDVHGADRKPVRLEYFGHVLNADPAGRREWTAGVTRKLAGESFRSGLSVERFAEEWQVSASLLSKWRMALRKPQKVAKQPKAQVDLEGGTRHPTRWPRAGSSPRHAPQSAQGCGSPYRATVVGVCCRSGERPAAVAGRTPRDWPEAGDPECLAVPPCPSACVLWTDEPVSVGGLPGAAR